MPRNTNDPPPPRSPNRRVFKYQNRLHSMLTTDVTRGAHHINSGSLKMKSHTVQITMTFYSDAILIIIITIIIVFWTYQFDPIRYKN